MKFEKGHKFSRGGTKGNKGGRPTREQAELKIAAAEAVKRYIERHAVKLAKRYVERALAAKADKVLMHAIDRLVPPAKPTMNINVNSPDEDFRKIQEKAQEAKRLIAERKALPSTTENKLYSGTDGKLTV
jgi:hypothetical protein